MDTSLFQAYPVQFLQNLSHYKNCTCYKKEILKSFFGPSGQYLFLVSIQHEVTPYPLEQDASLFQVYFPKLVLVSILFD